VNRTHERYYAFGLPHTWCFPETNTHRVLPSVPAKPGDSSTCLFYERVSELKGNVPVEIDELDEIETIPTKYIIRKVH